MYKILVLGMGNLLMSDDSLGVIALDELDKKYKQRREVCCLEIGTSVLNYISDIGKAETLLAIDAITAGHGPGTVYRIYVNKTNLVDSRNFFVDSHGAGLPEAVALSRELTGLPSRVIIYGIEPYSCEVGFSISSQVRNSLKRLVDLVQQDIDWFLKGK